MTKIIFTLDVEQDLHTPTYEGINFGLTRFEYLCDKHNIKPTLFVTSDCLKHSPQLFKKLQAKGWEIAFHGYSHRSFDSLSLVEKNNEFRKGVNTFKKYLKTSPKGFRAPQHSIDNVTLYLLKKYNFDYDSSYTPLNLLQLFFFPKRFLSWLNLFFSPLNPYEIKPSLKEVPTSSLIIPFVSLSLRVLPKFVIVPYIWLLKRFYKNPVFYAHSWDFIKLKKSKIDNLFSHEKLIENLDFVMGREK